jgi:hypothetical protein
MADDWVHKKACIVVKTYPIPAWNGIEVSCTAAITDDGKWLRLFPIPFRFLDEEKRFKKYQWVEVRVKRSRDPRPESYTIDKDSIKILGEPVDTKGNWAARKSLVMPLSIASYCQAIRTRDAEGFPTLGVFKPRVIERLVIERDRENWTDEELAKLRQGDFFDEGPPNELERIPFKFSYRFRCADNDCTGHTVMCSDWEMGQAYRDWRQKYGDGQWEEKFRQRFEHEMINTKDTHFYIGTVAQHPANWIIVGLFYPPL